MSAGRILGRVVFFVTLALVCFLGGDGTPVVFTSASIPVRSGEDRPDSFHFYDRALEAIGESRWEDALENLSRSLAENPDFVPALVNRGNVYLELGDLGRAGDDYRRALALEPHNPFAWNNLGLVYLNSERDEEAIVDFSRALSLDRDYAEAYLNRALALAGRGRIREARADLARAALLFERRGDAVAARKTEEIRQKIGN